MAPAWQRLLSDEPGNTKRKIAFIYSLLLIFNVGAWIWAFVAFRHFPVLLGTAFLAYSFGLRHAVDADHIAAIDNVTRKLMQSGKQPVTVGLMFSLGHSTVVVVGSMAIAASTMALHHQYAATNDIGGVLGTLVSTFFLFAIGFVNLVVLRSVYQTFRRVRSGKPYVEEDVDLLLGSRGILAKIFRPLFRMVDASWHMYPIGVLFGLGFDTATEIGVLGISAAEAAKGLSLCSILIFPALFAAGMSLVDTTDSILMVQAYGWALAKPLRKLYYNLTITFVSVVVAFAVGAIESLGLVADHLHPRGSFWVWIEQLNKNFGVLGYAMIAFFAASWLISVCIYKWKRFDAAELTS